jgi:hypothetical protein
MRSWQLTRERQIQMKAAKNTHTHTRLYRGGDERGERSRALKTDWLKAAELKKGRMKRVLTGFVIWIEQSHPFPLFTLISIHTRLWFLVTCLMNSP